MSGRFMKMINNSKQMSVRALPPIGEDQSEYLTVCPSNQKSAESNHGTNGEKNTSRNRKRRRPLFESSNQRSWRKLRRTTERIEI